MPSGRDRPTSSEHTLRLNALWHLPWDFNVAGAYFFGSGNYYSTSFSASPFGAVAGGEGPTAT